MTQEEKQLFMDGQVELAGAVMQHMLGKPLSSIKVEVVPRFEHALRVNDFPHEEDIKVRLTFESKEYIELIFPRGTGWTNINYFNPSKRKNGGSNGKHGRTQP